MPDLGAILAENDPRRLLPELLQEAGGGPLHRRALRKEARRMRLERRLMEKSEWLRRWRRGSGPGTAD